MSEQEDQNDGGEQEPAVNPDPDLEHFVGKAAPRERRRRRRLAESREQAEPGVTGQDSDS